VGGIIHPGRIGRLREDRRLLSDPTTFGLVHGAWHGAWCWDLLVPELEARGFRCAAVDLPTEDAACGALEAAHRVADALADAPGDVAVVGHSLAGLTIPLVPTLRPVRMLVYLCALVPQPGMSMMQQIRGQGVLSPAYPDLARHQIAHPDGSSEWPPEAAIDAFYHDCPPPTARWAASRLRRQAWKAIDETTPLDSLPGVPSASILCREDRVTSPEWSRRVAPERLGRPALELEGGHSPFLARPAELADVLAALLEP
jgi:pimeloyl-ACP methyl ester carboxylesterase